MLNKTISSLVALGSARRETRAISDGTHMELIGGQFYTKTGVGSDVTRLGSARAATRAVNVGERAELIPDLFYDVVGVRLV